jgi:hypothetical protein
MCVDGTITYQIKTRALFDFWFKRLSSLERGGGLAGLSRHQDFF